MAEETNVSGSACTANNAGSNFQILFIPGACAGEKSYENWITSCENHLTLAIAMDLRNRSKHFSPQQVGKIRVEMYLDDVEAMIGKINGPVVLVGHSLGGLLAQMAAASGNPNIKAIFLVSSIPPWRLFLSAFAWKKLLRPHYMKSVLRGKEFMFREKDALALGLEKARNPKEICRSLKPDSGIAIRQVLLGGVAVNPLDVKCPVIVIAGNYDKMIGIETQKRLARFYGAREFWRYDAGHALPWEEFTSDKVISRIVAMSRALCS